MNALALSSPAVARRAMIPTLASLARVVIGLLLLIAAGAKLSDVDAAGGTYAHGVPLFAAAIAAHHVLPEPFALPVAWAVLTAETIIGLWLLSHRLPKWAALAASLLLACFSVYLILARIQSGNATCGCFGRVTRGDLSFSLARNAILLAMLAPTFLPLKKKTIPSSAA